MSAPAVRSPEIVLGSTVADLVASIGGRERDSVALVDLVRRCNGKVTAVDNRDGRQIYAVGMPGRWATLGLLRRLVSLDAATFPEVTAVGAAVASLAGGKAGPLFVAASLQRIVQCAVKFRPEEPGRSPWDDHLEEFPDVRDVLARGWGDCDDHTLLFCVLCEGAGLEWGLGTLTRNRLGAVPHHVAPRVVCNGVSLWCETTCAARLGEHPEAAASRLGLTREDLS